MTKRKLKKMEVDFGLLVSILLLVAIGLIMVFSASSYWAEYKFGNVYNFIIKQGPFGLLGLIAMFIISRIDYHKYKKYNRIFMIITIIMLGLVWLFKARNGAHRWIGNGSISIQPSEIAKYVVVLFLAKTLSKSEGKNDRFIEGMVRPIIGIIPIVGLIVIQPSLSVTMVILGTTLAMILVGGGNLKHFLTLIGSVVAVGVIFIIKEPWRMNRIFSFTDPFQDAKGAGYQIIQSWYALASGGLFGQGLGQSRQKSLFIPEPHNDFIFAIIGEELGFIGGLAIICLYMYFIYRGLHIASKAKDTYGSLIALGITSIIAIQAIINIAVVTGAMPVTGVPLPFMSYGGTALMVNLMGMGVILNVSSQMKKSK